MDCHQATTLISEQIDHEIRSGDRAALDAHLSACGACRATADAFQLQDRDLRRLFAPCEPSTARVIAGVLAQLDARPAPEDQHVCRRRQHLARLLAVAATVGGLLLLSLFLHRQVVPRHGLGAGATASSPAADAEVREPLTPRPRPPATPPQHLAVGASVQTTAGERRRLALPDGSVLYVNAGTRARLDADRHLVLSAGEVFLEVAPRPNGSKAAAFVVQAPGREVKALGTKFAVRAEADWTGVLVTQGKVQVSGLTAPVAAGQQLAAGAEFLSPAPRASHALDWTEELMTAAETPLVPGSRYAGGALVAVDPYGQEAKISLRKFHIDVHIEDGFARTTIDQTYFNHESWRLEGTFYFPLPPDASLSRLAMYVDGKLMEGGMAERDYARQVFETIVTRQKDPALLEWVDGSTFKMRVFPLEGRQEKRIILSYTQKLDTLYGRTRYRFPAGHSMQQVRDWSFYARIKGGAGLTWGSSSHELAAAKEAGDLVLSARAHDIKPDKDVVLHLDDPAAVQAAGDRARFSSAVHEGARYLMLRYRPTLPAAPVLCTPKNWVFLFESSGDRDPLLARVQVDVIRTLLDNAEHDDTFAVLTAGTRVRTFADRPRPVTPENIKAAVDFLERTRLIGALDLGQALAAARPFLEAGGPSYLVHLGSGVAAMGEHREDVLAHRLPENTAYVGVGVGKRWARSFMKAAAERSGGYFTQINPDEPVTWRAFELFATLHTPRLLNVKVVDNAEKAVFLSYVSSLAQGEELCAIARLDPEGADLPESVTITGTLNGRPFQQAVPVADVAGHADYLPRTWAKLEIDRLLAEDAQKHKARVVALSKAMYVMTPFTSLLVLENEAMYAQYKVDRGRKDHWAMYPSPDQIPVVTEPDPSRPATSDGGPKTEEQVLQTILVRVPPRVLNWPGGQDPKYGQQGQPVIPLVTALQWYQGIPPTTRAAFQQDLQIPIINSSFSPAVRRSEVPKPATVLDDSDVPTLSKLPRRSGINGDGIGPMVTAPFINSNPSAANQFIPPYGGFPGSPMRDLAMAQNQGWGDRVGRIIIAGNEVTEPNLIHRPAPLYPGQILSGPFELSGERLLEEALDEGRRPADKRKTKLDDRERPTGLGLDFGWWSGNAEVAGNGSLLYQRPALSGDDRIYTDLIAYAPGMNTTLADILAVLEAEALPRRQAKPGHIDPAAHRLIDRARAAGWQCLTFPGQDDRPALTVSFNGRGQLASEHTLPSGLREQVVCDGRTLLHLYPGLGVGARRTVSRFHREEIARLVPWLLPPAGDLARGADLKAVDDQTVAVIPHGADATRDEAGKPVPYRCLHLIFAADGRLAERRLVEMPTGKTLSQETYEADGTIRLLDAEGRVVVTRQTKLSPANAPDLNPDTSRLVVLPLPLRTREHVRQVLKIDPANRFEELDEATALALFAAEWASRNSDALQVFGRRFHVREVRPLGFYTLLAANGVNVDAEQQYLNVLAVHPQEPLAEYLAFYSNPELRRHSHWGRINTPKDVLLQRLATFRVLSTRWQGGRARAGSETERRQEQERALDFVRQSPHSPLSCALLGILQNKAGNEVRFWEEIAEAWKLFEKSPSLGAVSRYERARCLLKAGRREAARSNFHDLYTVTLEAGTLPAIDHDFRTALQSDGTDEEQWTPLLRQAAISLVQRGRRLTVLALVRQCWQLGDQPLADDLLATALDGPAAAPERSAVALAAIHFLLETGQPARADRLLQPLLAEESLARHAALWRVGQRVAEAQHQNARAMTCLEKALEIEYRHLPDVINLQQVRTDYTALLGHFQQMADALNTLQAAPPPDLVARVTTAADRWRALDSDGTAACQAAAKVLQSLNARDLAWEYLTTPIGLQPNEAGPWLSLAQAQHSAGDFDLADRAYAAAFAAEPTNAQILWDRAQNLRQAGKLAEAQALYRQLADRDWQPRFRGLQSQARQQVGRH